MGIFIMPTRKACSNTLRPLRKLVHAINRDLLFSAVDNENFSEKNTFSTCTMIVGTSLVLMSAHNLCFVAKITKTAFPSIPQFLHRSSRVIHYTDVCTDVFLMAVWSNTDSELKLL